MHAEDVCLFVSEVSQLIEGIVYECFNKAGEMV